MKKIIFEQYIAAICNLYNISKEQLFEKTKTKEIVNARYLLYYLCSKRNMGTAELGRYLDEIGSGVNATTIHYAIKVVTSRVDEDRDYWAVVKRISESVNVA